MRRPPSLVLLPQITVTDVANAVRNLDAEELYAAVEPLIPYTPDMPTTPEVRLLRALLDVPLVPHAPLREWLAPYKEVAPEWREVVVKLRVRDLSYSSALAHPLFTNTATFVVTQQADGVWVSFKPAVRGRSRLLRPHARTLAVQLQRRPGGVTLVPAFDASTNGELEELAAQVGDRVRSTLGGDDFLAPDPFGQALSVLSTTAATILGNSQRWHGRDRYVRADVYESIFEALGWRKYFAAARRVLELDHPKHLAVRAPWPAGNGVEVGDLAILKRRGKYLQLLHPAILDSLPDLPNFTSTPEVPEDSGDNPFSSSSS